MKAITDLSRLCVHTITTKPWSIEEAAEAFSSAGVTGITVWQDAYQGRTLPAVRTLLQNHGLSVVSLCRGGFFPHAQAKGRQEAIDNNKQMIEEAAIDGVQLAKIECVDENPCPGDMDGSGDVGVDDVLAVLGAYGSNDPSGDVNGDGTVNVDDILAVVAAFGPC